MNYLFKSIILFVILFSTTVIANPADNKNYQVIINNINNIVLCWNKHKLDCVLNYYDHSPKTIYIGGNKTTMIKGFKKIKASFKQRFANGLGHLSIQPVTYINLSRTALFFIGKFTLILNNKQSSGYTSLLWQFKHRRWVIVSDHSS